MEAEMLDISNFSGEDSIDVDFSVETDQQGSNPQQLTISVNTGGGGGGGGTGLHISSTNSEATIEGGVDKLRRAAGIFSSIAKVTIFIASMGTLHPPKDLPSNKFLSLTYYSAMILLFMLGLLLFALAYALSVVVTGPHVPAVHFVARKLALSSLLLLLLVASLGAYGVFVTGPPVPLN